ncbi:MAG TPA: Gfo/Idh/MocA family oxidoreductase [Spirochaetota bacterium]|nr:Gfo/Idh/MocA family oxidoreductase [Spirochaetota bacterium]
MNKQFAVIGCGARLKSLTPYLLKQRGLKLSAVYDHYPARAQAFCRAVKKPDTAIYNNCQDLLRNDKAAWVLIGSPNALHKKHITAAFKSGKNVFAEKPLATSIPDCLAVTRAHRQAQKLFATGFVLRYAPIYKKVKQLLDSGRFGKIISIAANENITPAHGAYIMRNWRRWRGLAGSHILEKCVHDLDLLNWFTGSLPRRIAAFGGNDLWVKKNKSAIPAKVYNDWPGKEFSVKDPFSSAKDIEDNLVLILEFYNGTKAQFQATTANIIPERRMYLSCTRGNIIIELYSSVLRYQLVNSTRQHTIRFTGDLHGGGDTVIMQQLARSIKQQARPACSGREGLQSAVTAITADKARIKGSVINLDRTWQQLGMLNKKQ